MYKLIQPLFQEIQISTVMRLLDNACIPFDPANTDYVRFKKQIAEETAELQDADGNTMSPEEIAKFLTTLP